MDLPLLRIRARGADGRRVRVSEIVADGATAGDPRLAGLEPERIAIAALADTSLAQVDVLVAAARVLQGSDDATVPAVAARVPLLVVIEDRAEEEVAARAGANDVVRSPFTPSELVRRLSVLAELRATRRTLAVAQSALAQVDGLTIAEAGSTGLPLAYVSPAFESMTGYASTDILGKNCRFLQTPETDPIAVAQLRAAIAAGARARVVLMNRRRSGSTFWNDLTVFPIHDDDGTLVYYGGIQHDVTELVEARAEVARRESTLRGILEGLHVAIATADESGTLTFINEEACATLGVLASESVGRPVADVLRLPEAAAAFIMSGRGGLERLEYTYRAPERPPREIGLSIRRGAGITTLVGAFLVFRDVAQQRQAERLERLAAVSTMAAGFAHEVRNPLASLGMLSEMLVAELGPEDPRLRIVERMTRQVTRIERLVRTSLKFARPERPRLGTHAPWALVNAALEALAPRLRAMSGAVGLDFEDELPRVVCDDAQLVQVLVILLNNAIDACGSTDGIRIAAVQEREYVPGETAPIRSVRLSVADAGPGVPEHLRKSIFHPFFTTKPSGTGLGLSIAQQIVHENRGRIELEAPSAGTTGAVFSVVLATEAA